MNLTTAARELHELSADLTAHIESAKKEEARLRAEIRQRRSVLELSASGIDLDKVNLAKTIVFVRGTYARGGDDRASVIADAIKQFATGVPPRAVYGDLWSVAFGTKSYDRWYGQRTDCEYGCGPGHGSIIFQVGILDQVRKSRTHADLTPDEIEAVIYFLTNLERVQAAEAIVAQQAEAASSPTQGTRRPWAVV